MWRYCLEIAQGFVANGAAVALVAMGPPPSGAQRAEARGAGVRLVETGLPLDWLADDAQDLQIAARELAGIARQVGAATIQLHSPLMEIGPRR